MIIRRAIIPTWRTIFLIKKRDPASLLILNHCVHSSKRARDTVQTPVKEKGMTKERLTAKCTSLIAMERLSFSFILIHFHFVSFSIHPFNHSKWGFVRVQDLLSSSWWENEPCAREGNMYSIHTIDRDSSNRRETWVEQFSIKRKWFFGW